MSITPHQTKLLSACARNLRDFGYPDATADNVMTTKLFWLFARGWLEERAEAGEQDAADLLTMGDRFNEGTARP